MDNKIEKQEENFSKEKKNKQYPKINLDICKSCSACADVCPTTAISMKQLKSPSLRLFPELDSSKCIVCKRCVLDCPINAVVLKILT